MRAAGASLRRGGGGARRARSAPCARGCTGRARCWRRGCARSGAPSWSGSKRTVETRHEGRAGSTSLDRALRALAAETDEDAAPAAEARRARPSGRGRPQVAPEPAPSPWVVARPRCAAAAGVVWMARRRTRAGRGSGGAVGRLRSPGRNRARTAGRARRPAAPVAVAARAGTRRAPRPRRGATAAPFEALYPGDPLADLDAVHVVRVSVPRSSLFDAGPAARPGAPDDAVEMDAMVGPDGVDAGRPLRDGALTTKGPKGTG